MEYLSSKATPVSKQVESSYLSYCGFLRCCSLLYIFRTFTDKANGVIEYRSFPLWINVHCPTLIKLYRINCKRNNYWFDSYFRGKLYAFISSITSVYEAESAHYLLTIRVIMLLLIVMYLTFCNTAGDF